MASSACGTYLPEGSSRRWAIPAEVSSTWRSSQREMHSFLRERTVFSTVGRSRRALPGSYCPDWAATVSPWKSCPMAWLSWRLAPIARFIAGHCRHSLQNEAGAIHRMCHCEGTLIMRRTSLILACLLILYAGCASSLNAQDAETRKLQHPKWRFGVPVTKENVQSRSHIAVVSPDERMIAVRVYPPHNVECIVLFDRKTGREIRRLATREEVGHQFGWLSFSPDSKHLLSWSGQEFRYWSVETGEVLLKHGIRRKGPIAGPPIFHPTGKYFVSCVGSGAQGNLLLFWDRSTLKHVGSFNPRGEYPWFDCDQAREMSCRTKSLHGSTAHSARRFWKLSREKQMLTTMGRSPSKSSWTMLSCEWPN